MEAETKVATRSLVGASACDGTLALRLARAGRATSSTAASVATHGVHGRAHLAQRRPSDQLSDLGEGRSPGRSRARGDVRSLGTPALFHARARLKGCGDPLLRQLRSPARARPSTSTWGTTEASSTSTARSASSAALEARRVTVRPPTSRGSRPDAPRRPPSSLSRPPSSQPQSARERRRAARTRPRPRGPRGRRASTPSPSRTVARYRRTRVAAEPAPERALR